MPLTLAATLAAGLRDDSRIKMKISGARVNNEIWLLAAAVDRLSILIWQQSNDGAAGRNYPELITKKLIELDEPNEVIGFDSGKDFEEAWRAL